MSTARQAIRARRKAAHDPRYKVKGMVPLKGFERLKEERLRATGKAGKRSK